MPFFRYTVADKTGKQLNGTMNARDEAELNQRLVSMGYTVVSVIGAASAPSAPAAGAGAAVRKAAPRTEGIPPSLEPRIPLRTLATYLRQMATMIRSGMTPYQATAEIKERTRNRRLRRSLEAMEGQVQGGGHLSPVMTSFPDVFPTKIVGLVYCGELGGYLDRALDEAATDVEQEASARLWPRLIAGFVRLNILFAFLLWPTLRLDQWLPVAAGSVTAADSPAESAAKTASAFLAFYGQAFFRNVLPPSFLFLTATYFWPQIKRMPNVRSWLDAFIVKVPIWGSLHMNRALLRFGKSLQQLYLAGIVPGTAWTAACSSVPNSLVANRLRSAGGVLNSGGTLSATIDAAGVFDEDSKALMMAGEQAGDIPAMLQQVVDRKAQLASMQHGKGRFISTHLIISAMIAVTGLFTIALAYYYFEAAFKVVDVLFGGQ